MTHRNTEQHKSHRLDEDVDREVVQRCESFVGLYSRAFNSLYAFTLSLVGATDVADDIMQEAGLLLWQKFDDFAEGTSFERWAKAFVRNLVSNFHRTRRPVHLSFDDDLLTKISKTREAADEWLELRRPALRTCISNLHQRERNLISLCYAEHSSIAAAADQLSESLNAVYKKLRRIRIKLFRCVEKRLGVEGMS